MSATIAIKNARNTARCAALRRLVEAFSKKNITRCQASSILSIGDSTARNYISDLKRAGIVEEIGHMGLSHIPVYGLCASKSKVDRFLNDLDAGSIPPRDSSVPAVEPRPIKERPLSPPAPRCKAFRDPLVAALFGPAGVRQ